MSELIVHKCDGEEIFYRTVPDYELEKQEQTVGVERCFIVSMLSDYCTDVIRFRICTPIRTA